MFSRNIFILFFSHEAIESFKCDYSIKSLEWYQSSNEETKWFLTTSASDPCFSLWDIEMKKFIFKSKQHSLPLKSSCFHPDGGLVAIGGSESDVCLWDLRSGRNIWRVAAPNPNCHSGAVLSISVSPNGYHMATGGEDNSIRLWDLRKLSLTKIIPAHTGAVTTVKYVSDPTFFGTTSSCLVSGSFDGHVKMWGSCDGAPVHSVNMDSKSMALDVGLCYNQKSPSVTITSANYDKTFKTWIEKKLAPCQS